VMWERLTDRKRVARCHQASGTCPLGMLSLR
jgi:hypothetical protein